MPIDSEKKRRSTIPGTLPRPDGVIDEGDRRTVTGVYDITSGTPDSRIDLVRLSVIRIRVDVKITRDRGKATSSAAGPVTVSFNKVFADITHIDVFPVSNSGQKIFRVIDFLDAPNPTSFDVELFDNTGTRLALDFGWEASGILRSA